MREASERSTEHEATNDWKRWATTAAGGTLLAVGLARRTWPGYAAALAGGWLTYRGLTGSDRDVELVSLEAVEASAEALEVERSLTMQAPVDHVRAFLSDPANLDAALDDAGTVQALGDDLHRWTLASPTGHALSWDMQAEDLASEDELSWSSTGEIDLEVEIELVPIGDEATEVTMTLSLEPPGGSIGQALMQRLDVVPHALVAGFLQRTRTLVEARAPASGAASPDRPPEPPTDDTGPGPRSGVPR